MTDGTFPLNLYGGSRNNGNVLTQSVALPGTAPFNQSYRYDTLNRLESSSESGNWSRTYSYDAYGNMWVSAWAGIAPHAVLTPQAGAAFDPATNRIVGFGYDTAGNLTGANAVTYTYDAENRMTRNETTINGTTYINTYQYDGNGRRVRKTVDQTTTVYVYDAMGQMMAEYSSAAPSATETLYITADHLGSTRLVTDQAKVRKECRDFLPFGEEISSSVGDRSSFSCYTAATQVNQKFTGKERDSETGLDYFGARYFSSPQARFTTIDPKLTSARTTQPQSWNRYSYVQNNPLKFVDPNGAELRLAPGLPSQSEQRIIRNLAAAYRTDVGRAALHQLAESPMIHTYGQKKLPDETVSIGGKTYLRATFGRTDPNYRGTLDSKGRATSIDKAQSSVDVNIDFDKIDRLKDALTRSEQQITLHEVGHDLDADTDPVRERNQSSAEAEKNAEAFVGQVEKAKPTMSQKDAEREVTRLLKKEQEEKKK